VEPRLVGAWVKGRCVNRGLPMPAEDHGGWRVETGLPDEVRRYVFAGDCEGLRALGEMIFEERVYLKASVSTAQLRAMLPARWAMDVERFVMVCWRGKSDFVPALPEGYGLEVGRDGEVVRVRVVDAQGALAAGGNAVGVDGVFTFDQIVTEDGHQRRGLGRVVMAALEAHGRCDEDVLALVATDAGRALYLALGWEDYAPYATAGIGEVFAR